MRNMNFKHLKTAARTSTYMYTQHIHIHMNACHGTHLNHSIHVHRDVPTTQMRATEIMQAVQEKPIPDSVSELAREFFGSSEKQSAGGPGTVDEAPLWYVNPLSIVLLVFL